MALMLWGGFEIWEPEKGAGGTGGTGGRARKKPVEEPKPEPDPKPEPSDEEDDDEEDDDEEEVDDEEDDDDDSAEEIEAARRQIEKLKAKLKTQREKAAAAQAGAAKGKGKGEGSTGDSDVDRRLERILAENEALKREKVEAATREKIGSKLAAAGVPAALIPLLSAGLLKTAVDEDGELELYELSSSIKSLKKSVPALFGVSNKKPSTAHPDTGKGKGSDKDPAPGAKGLTSKDLAKAAREQRGARKKRHI